MRDAADEQEGGATLPPGLLRAMVGTLCTLAHALHDAAAAVAAAALPAAGEDPLRFGSACWRHPQPWTNVLAVWALSASSLVNLDFSPALDRHPDPGGAAVTARTAAVALLRLLPLLPAQPVRPGGDAGIVTAAAVEATARGGVTALHGRFVAGGPQTLLEEPGVAVTMLTVAVPPIAASLLRHCIGLAQEAAAHGAPPCAEDGAAALMSLAAVCRYAHALAAALGLGDAARTGSEAVQRLLALPVGAVVSGAIELLETAWQVFEQFNEHCAKPNPDQTRWGVVGPALPPLCQPTCPARLTPAGSAPSAPARLFNHQQETPLAGGAWTALRCCTCLRCARCP
jgi:hypothetical protein